MTPGFAPPWRQAVAWPVSWKAVAITTPANIPSSRSGW